MSITSDRIKENGFIHQLADDAVIDIEQMERDIVHLLESREHESERLEWILARISDVERNRLIGQMTDRHSVSEWREKIDKAMGYP
jgi:hypothetical protein